MDQKSRRGVCSLEVREDGVVVLRKLEASDEQLVSMSVVLFLSLCFAAFCIFGPFLSPSPWTVVQKAASCAAGLAILGLGGKATVFLYRRLDRGDWIFDDQGVAFHPKQGPSRFCRWKDVERICWKSSKVVLLGGGSRIALDVNRLSAANWSRIQQRIEIMLAGRFDLSSKPKAPPERVAVSILVIAVILAAPFFLLCAFFLLPDRNVTLSFQLLERTVAFAVNSLMIGLIVVPCCLIGLSARELQRQKVAWRYPKGKPADWVEL